MANIKGDKSTQLTAPISSTYKYTLRAYFEEQDTYVSNNTSKIYCEASLAASQIAFDNNKGGNLSVYWHDNNTNEDSLVATLQVKQCGKDYGTKWVGGTIYPTHKSDGTLSGYAIAKWERLVSNNYVPYNGSVSTDNTALTRIPRQATITEAPDFTDIQDLTVKYNNSAGNAVSSLQMCIALTESSAESNPAIAYRDVSKTGSSYTFNFTEAERNVLRQSIPNANSRNVWIFIKTVIAGTTYYSYKIAKFSVVNANPLVNSVEYEDTNAQTTLITNNPLVIIRNKSQLAITVGNIWSYKYATLVSMTTTINGVTKTTSLSGTHMTDVLVDFGTINVASDTNASIVVTDSRGNTVTYTLSLTVWDWITPSAIYNIYRLSNFYTESKILVDANYSSLDGNNTIDIKYRIKKHEETTWGAYVTLQDNTEADFNADNLYAWDVQIVVTDRLGSYTYTINKALDIGIPIFFIDVLLRSVGINYFPKNSGSIETDGIDLRNIYSTDEKKVGTWIDGKPIYRKVITQNNANNISNVATNIENIIKMECMVRQAPALSWRNLPWLFVQNNSFGSPSWGGGFYYQLSDNSINFQLGSDLGNVDKVIITLEYTKTTD